MNDREPTESAEIPPLTFDRGDDIEPLEPADCVYLPTNYHELPADNEECGELVKWLLSQIPHCNQGEMFAMCARHFPSLRGSR